MLKRWRSPSADTGLGALVLALSFGVFITGQYDPDFWWSLRIGQLIVALRHMPEHLPWTFTVPGAPFVGQEWGSEAMYAVLWAHGGMVGIILLMALATWLGLIFAWRCIPAHTSLLGRCGAVLLLLVAGDAAWGPRAQMFTFVGVAFVIWAVRNKWDDWRWRWSIVPVVWFWAQVHGGFSYGLGLLAVYLVGVGIQSWWTKQPRRGLGAWWLAWLVAAGAAMVNPNGIAVYSYVIDLLNQKAAMSLVAEWQSPNFHDPRMWAVVIAIGLVGAGAWTKRAYRPELAEGLVLLAALWWALDSVRNVPLFMVLAVPTMAVAIDMVVARIQATRKGVGASGSAEEATQLASSSRRRQSDLLLGGVALVLGIGLVLGLGIPKVESLENQEFSSSYPVAVAQWVCAHPSVTRLFGPLNETGWLLSAIDPSGYPGGACTAVRVEEFGELPMMGNRLIENAASVAGGGANTFSFLDHWRIQAVWTPTGETLGLLLSLKPQQWRLAMNKGGNDIFVRRNQ